MKPNISLVGLGVRDLEWSKQFYEHGLGFPTHNYSAGDDCIFLRLEGAWLSLYPRITLAMDAGVSDQGSGFSGTALAHNVASRAEVDAVLRGAAATGARITKPEQEAAWGAHQRPNTFGINDCGLRLHLWRGQGALQISGYVTLSPRLFEADVRVTTDGQLLLFAQVAVFQPPQLPAGRLYDQEEAAVIMQFILIFPCLSGADRGVCQGHWGSLFQPDIPAPPK